MAIGVSSTVHAAVTLYVTTDAKGDTQFLQSPQGCILQRVPIDGESGTNGWLILLDYGLDSGSCALCVVPFQNHEAPQTPQAAPVIPILFHIDDRVKALVTVTPGAPNSNPQNQSFHALFLNYQANQQEIYPVDIGVLPGGGQR